MGKSNSFQPNWISPPGDTISDILTERGISLSDFAQQIGDTPTHANKLLDGLASINAAVAKRLEETIGGSAAFWMARETQYREDAARLGNRTHDVSEDEWLRALPVRDMLAFGWIKPDSHATDKVEACLRFFGVPDVRSWHASYRGILETAAFRTSSSFPSQPAAVAAWLRQGEIESASISCAPWNAKRFRELLWDIRILTRKKDPEVFVPELKKRCAECGVAVAIIRAPTGCRASGATRFLLPTRALLLLSFRYLSDDHFWFTFFHEAGHLLLHDKKALFLEGAEMITTEEEEEANEFAAHILIPPSAESALAKLRARAHDVIRFARRIGVCPGTRRSSLPYSLRQFTNWYPSERESRIPLRSIQATDG